MSKSEDVYRDSMFSDSSRVSSDTREFPPRIRSSVPALPAL